MVLDIFLCRGGDGGREELLLGGAHFVRLLVLLGAAAGRWVGDVGNWKEEG